MYIPKGLKYKSQSLSQNVQLSVALTNIFIVSSTVL